MIAEQIQHLALPIADLSVDGDNARVHGSKNLDAIKESLTRFGQRVPLVVQKDGMVVRAGNGRLVAAMELGWEEIAAVVVDDDDAEAMAFALADNRTGDLAEWDDRALLDILQGWDEEAQTTLGFSTADVDALAAGLGVGGFEPNVDPIAGLQETSQEDIDAAEKRLAEIGEGGAKTFEVCCPHCAETFEVQA